MNQEVMEGEVVRGTDQEDDREEGTWVGVSAGSEKREAKTQGNPTPT